MDMLLLAEGVTLDYKVLFSIVSAAVGVGGTIAVLKFRAGHNEKETKSAKHKVEKESEKREEKDEKLAEKLDGIARALGENTDMLKSRMVKSEKEQRELVETFQSKTFAKLDGINEKLAEHDKRITVAETEREHLKKDVEKHGKKLTRMPTGE